MVVGISIAFAVSLNGWRTAAHYTERAQALGSTVSVPCAIDKGLDDWYRPQSLDGNRPTLKYTGEVAAWSHCSRVQTGVNSREASMVS